MGELYVLASGQGKSSVLTDEDKALVSEKIDLLPQSKESMIYNEIKNNPEAVKANVSSEGYSKAVNVTFDAVTESTRIEDADTVAIDPELDGAEEVKIDYEVTEDDVKTHSELSVANFENMSDEAALELVKLINKTRKGTKIKFSDLPQEIQDGLIEYLDSAFDIPVSDYSEKSKRIRNEVADALMQEYIKTIEIDKYMEQYNYQVEHLFDDTISEISPIFKQYNDSNNKYFEELVEKADTPEKKKLGEKILEAIKDAYDLEGLKECIPKTRIKKFDVEKPNRVFDSLHGKYTSPKYHIYNLYGCAVTLSKHLFTNNMITDAREARDLAIKLLIVFCKRCQNYKTDNADEHAYMYYFTYNIYLLDMYKGEQYEQYMNEYLKGYVKSAIDVLKESGK